MGYWIKQVKACSFARNPSRVPLKIFQWWCSVRKLLLGLRRGLSSLAKHKMCPQRISSSPEAVKALLLSLTSNVQYTIVRDTLLKHFLKMLPGASRVNFTSPTGIYWGTGFSPGHKIAHKDSKYTHRVHEGVRQPRVYTAPDWTDTGNSN